MTWMGVTGEYSWDGMGWDETNHHDVYLFDLILGHV